MKLLIIILFFLIFFFIMTLALCFIAKKSDDFSERIYEKQKFSEISSYFKNLQSKYKYHHISYVIHPTTRTITIYFMLAYSAKKTDFNEVKTEKSHFLKEIKKAFSEFEITKYNILTLQIVSDVFSFKTEG